MNKKGFTLIELLAVIIILGILMIIAIPSVTKCINDSRKSAYIDTAKQVASATKNLVNSGKLEMYDTNVAYYIPNTCIKVENGEKAKSPYGEFIDDRTYVVVTYDGKGYSYYWVSLDDTGTGVKEPISIDKLNEDNIESDLKKSDVKDNIGLGKESVVIFNPTCDGRIDKDAYSVSQTIINDNQGELVKLGNDNAYVFRGHNPNNYVEFNGEEWRILGIYDNKIKIVRSESIGLNKYSDPNNDSNNWQGSGLQVNLNSTYYDSLNENSKKIISNGNWYAGEFNYYTMKALNAYENAKSTIWDGNVGLISAYEFLYAAEDDSCYDINPNRYSEDSYGGCGKSNKNWISQYASMWTLSPNVSYSFKVTTIMSNGVFDTANTSGWVVNTHPAVFLKPSVTIVSGDGTINNKYVFA